MFEVASRLIWPLISKCKGALGGLGATAAAMAAPTSAGSARLGRGAPAESRAKRDRSLSARTTVLAVLPPSELAKIFQMNPGLVVSTAVTRHAGSSVT